jgi:hypothetical protein
VRCILLLAVALCGMPAAANAQLTGEAAHEASPSGPSDALLREAVSAYARGELDEARRLFEEAHLVEPTARTHRGLGVVALREERYVDAVHHLRAALRSTAKPLTPALRDGVEVLLAEANAHVAELELEVVPRDAELDEAGVRLTAEPDGRVLVAAGPHTLTCSAPGYVSAQLLVSIAGGASQHLALALEPISTTSPPAAEPRSEAGFKPRSEAATARPAPHRSPGDRARRRRRALLGLGGVSAAAGIAAAITGGLGLARIHDIEAQCQGKQGGQCDGDEAAALAADAHLSRLNALTNAWLGVMASGAVGAVSVLPFYLGARSAGRDHGMGVRFTIVF